MEGTTGRYNSSCVEARLSSGSDCLEIASMEDNAGKALKDGSVHGRLRFVHRAVWLQTPIKGRGKELPKEFLVVHVELADDV